MFVCLLNKLSKYRVINCNNLKTISGNQNVLLKQKRFVSIRVQPKEERSNTEFLKWVLLGMPVTAFGLGCWQVQRRQWKLDLIKNLTEKINTPPVYLPDNLADLDAMEYRPVIVRGHFLHDREFTIGPRTKIDQSENPSETSFFKNNSSNVGFLVITPFKLSDREDIILINRGWVGSKLRDKSTRPSSLIKGELELEGVVRLHEKRGQFMPKNNPMKQHWMYRDLEEMGNFYGTSPVWLDLKADKNTKVVDGWPYANQTRVTIRNEHMSYIITWFGLCAATSWMWFSLYIKKLPLP